MYRRSQKEIEQDCSRIKEATKTATCMKDLENMTGLSASQINYSLRNHPIIFKRIKKQLDTNKANAEALKEKQKKEVSNATEKQFIEFVIDASITGYEGLNDTLNQIRTTEAKITLTSTTIHELDKLQKLDDVQALDARHILALAAKEPENFKVVAIAKKLETADDDIIQYCVDNKERVTLLTSDKVMALKARMYGVQVEYLVLPSHQQKIQNVASSEISKSKDTTLGTSNKKAQSANFAQMSGTSKVLPKGFSRYPIVTLPYTQYFGKKLTFSTFHSKKMSARVFANGREYNSGIVNLFVGDDIFIVTKQAQGISFKHYKMIDISSENNCHLIFNKTILRYDIISTIQNERYRAFIRDCMRRCDL